MLQFLKIQKKINLQAMTTLKATSQRIISLDALRGFALLGILIMNVISHSLPSAHYTNPMAGGALTGMDYYAFVFSQLFANQKFISLFAILFGAGVILLTERIDNAGKSAAKKHYIRNFWLLVFGLLHAYVIWYGDVLVQYATCAVWIYFFRKLSARALFICSGIFFLITLALNLGTGFSLPYWETSDVVELCKDWQPSAEALQSEISAYQSSWSEHFPYRRKMAFALETFIFIMGIGWQITGLMLLGMALFKSKILTAERTKRFYKLLALIGVSLGLFLGIIGLQQNQSAGWSCEFSFFIGSQYTMVASLPMALGYIGLIIWWYKQSGQKFLTTWLAPVGRMALTNYLMQSIISTFIFYGHGLGLYGTMGRASLWWVIIGIWVFQIITSRWWLSKFKFGPFEWVWRSLTYWKLQDFKK